MPSNIERSPGLPIGVQGLTAGGGGTGFTPELDNLVQQAAEALTGLYGGAPVAIRFNSDRLSGGAWLKTVEKDYIGGNAEVGIRAAQAGPDDAPIIFASLRRVALLETWETEYAESQHHAVTSIPEAVAVLKRIAVLDIDELQRRMATLLALKNS